MNGLTMSAKLHLIGQCVALFAQTVLPESGLSDHTLHLVAALLAWAQGCAGIWAVFISAHETDAPK